jgi:hypothetical protein
MGEPPRLSVVPLSMLESSSRPPLPTLMPLAVAPRAPKIYSAASAGVSLTFINPASGGIGIRLHGLGAELVQGPLAGLMQVS